MTMAQKSTKVEIQELNLKTFKQKVWNFDKNKTFVREGKTPIILDFYATWCRPCKMLAPHLHALQEKYNGKIIIYEIDVDKEPELAQRFNVNAMPTLVFIGSATGYKTELGYQEYADLEKIMNNHFFNKK
jgi:thioredoxin